MSHTMLPFAFAVFTAVVSVILARLVLGPRATAPILRAGALSIPPARPPAGAPLDPAIRATAADLAALAQRGGTGMEMGVPAGIAIHLDPAVLHEAMREVLVAAIRAAPGGTIRIAAARRGRRLDLTVSDDGPALDEVARRVSLAGAASLLAPYGIEVLVKPRLGLGTAVTLRIPGELLGAPTARARPIAGAPEMAASAC